MPFSIDSNSSQAYYGEETALGLQSQGPYTPLEINSYSDQGVDTKTVQRQTLNVSRQQQKGTITETNVVAGFQSDFTQTNLARLMQGFYFADVIEKPTTAPTNGTQVTTTAVSGTGYTLAVSGSRVSAEAHRTWIKFYQLCKQWSDVAIGGCRCCAYRCADVRRSNCC